MTEDKATQFWAFHFMDLPCDQFVCDPHHNWNACRL